MAAATDTWSMGTVVAIESDNVVAIAGDTRTVDGGTVTGTATRVFALDTAAVGVVGKQGDVQAFERRVESELDEQRLKRGEDLEIDEVARIAARHAEAAAVDAVISAMDREGTARLRQVGSDGRVLDDDRVALGSGAQVAYGQLEGLGSVDDPADAARAVVETVIERDTATGGDVDVLTVGGDTEDPVDTAADGGKDGDS